jgi:predicted 3-demethylubiquinone-9 3-methyltransferase (glyoxalase superfamily)
MGVRPPFTWDLKELVGPEKTDQHAFQFTLWIDTAHEHDTDRFFKDLVNQQNLHYEVYWRDKFYHTTQKRENENSPWEQYGK